MLTRSVDTARLYVQTMGYLRGDQLLQMAYRRLFRRSSPAHRALDRPRVRESVSADFPLAHDTKLLDRLSFVGRDTWPNGSFDWQTSDTWQPLRYQLHYFDYLNDPHRSQEWKRAIVSDWIEKNPPDKGDGWIAYAVSLRIVNWIKFLTRMVPADIDELWLGALYGQVLWLESNLELHILANHYLKNAKALLFAGLFFVGADAERWQKRGLEIFLAQCKEQFLADGGHYERSPMYHAIAVEDVLDVYVYVSAAGYPQAASTLEALRAHALAGLDFMTAILMPDGTLPLFNDTAEGTGPSPVELYAYAKATLGYEPVGATRGLSVRALEASGYYVIRDAASMLVIDCGAPGPEYQPGHGHCDCLSYELALDGERVVVDAGVLDYENNAARRYARGTAAHNTVQIDAVEQSEMWDVFRVARRACPIGPSLSLAGPGIAAFAGAHDGFQRSAAKAVHRRAVRYEHDEWVFEDSIDGAGDHLIASRVHLHPGLVAHRTAGVVSIETQNGRHLADLRPSSNVECRLEFAAHFPRFGNAQEGRVVVMSLEGKLPATLSYVIAPPAAAPAALSSATPA